MERRIMLFSTVMFFLGLFILLLLPPRDPDLGWQLRCGQDLWQNHQLCNINRYTVLQPGYNWPSHYWLYQALLYPAYLALGSWGLTLIASFVLTASLLFLFLTQPFLIALFSTLILCLFSSSVFSLGIRSQIVSFLFYSILLYLFRNKSSPKTYWLGLLVVWLWTQIHGSFVIGVLFFLFQYVSDVISYIEHRRLFSPIPPIPLIHLIPLILLIPLTLLNPNGILVYQEAWRHFSTVKLNLLIAEWVPPTWPYAVGMLVLLFSAIYSLSKKFTLSSIPLIIFSIGVTYLGLKARRFVPFSAITLLFYITKSNIKLISLDTLISQYPILKFIFFIVCFFPLVFGVVYQLPKTLAANQAITPHCLKQAADSPCGAIDYLKNQPDRSPIFNRYEWGGILNWNLPEFQLFVDGRMPAWQTPSGKSPYTIYLEILQTQPGWQKTLDSYHIGWLLISPGTFMDLLLQPNPTKYGYEEKYRDSISVIYHRLPNR